MPEEKLTRAIVVKHLTAEIAAIDRVSKQMDEGKIEDPSDSEDYREPLAADVTKVVTILLSTGGPEDGFKLYFDAENNLTHGVYYMANWGEYEEVSLDDDEADKVYDFYLGGEFPE